MAEMALSLQLLFLVLVAHLMQQKCSASPGETCYKDDTYNCDGMPGGGCCDWAVSADEGYACFCVSGGCGRGYSKCKTKKPKDKTDKKKMWPF